MIELKPASASDIEILRKLSDVIWHLHFPDVISIEQIDYMLAVMYSPETIRNELEKGIIWKIIYKNREPSGYFSYSMLDEKICKLHKIYVHPDLHGRGIGRLCINDVREYAFDNKAKSIILNVNRNNNKAIQAYLKYGFKIIKEQDTVFGRFVLNDYLMKMDILHGQKVE